MQVVIESTVLLFALICGSMGYKYKHTFFNLLFLQVVVWIVFYLLSHLVIYVQAKHGQQQNNQWLYNISSAVEVLILLFAAHTCFKQSLTKKLIVLGACLYFLVALISAGLWGMKSFNSFPFVIGSLVIVTTYAALLYRFFHERENTSLRRAVLLAAGGIFIFFTCNLPYFSLFNYLNQQHLSLSKVLFLLITNVLANLRYLLLGIAFIILKSTQNPSHVLQHDRK